MLEKLKKLKIEFGLKSIILCGVCVALVLVDLLTKIFEEKYDWNFVVIPGLIKVISDSHNPGCAFSFLAEASWGQQFLIAMTFILLAALIAIFILMPERLTFLKVALMLIISGAIGNLIDRIAFKYVRDFVEINMFGWVSCNFADFWIVFGSVIAVIDILFLNEWAIIPLTKTAKEAQAKKAAEEAAGEQAAETVQSAERAENSESTEESAKEVTDGEADGNE